MNEAGGNDMAARSRKLLLKLHGETIAFASKSLSLDLPSPQEVNVTLDDGRILVLTFTKFHQNRRKTTLSFWLVAAAREVGALEVLDDSLDQDSARG